MIFSVAAATVAGTMPCRQIGQGTLVSASGDVTMGVETGVYFRVFTVGA